MALNCVVGDVTQPAGVGNQTISLASNFNPKAIMMWTTASTASGTITAGWSFGVGFGTYRDATVQQGYMTSFRADAAATMNVAQRGGGEALLGLLIDGGTGALDLEIDLVSMQSGATSQVVINWTNVHTTASIKVSYMILGGSSISDAYVDTIQLATGSSVQDVTLPQGFGRPDLMGFISTTTATVNTTEQLSLPTVGWAKTSTERRYHANAQTEGDTNSLARMSQGDGVLEFLSPTGETTSDGKLDLAVASAWPVDGFELTKPTAIANTPWLTYLALKGTFTSKISSNTNPTAAATQTQNLDFAPNIPKGILVWGGNLATIAGIDNTAADLVGWGIGCSDFTNYEYNGVSDDDAQGTSDTNKIWSSGNLWKTLSVTATNLAQANTATLLSSIVQLSWNVTDATAREYNYVIFGDKPAVPNNYQFIKVGNGMSTSEKIR